MDKLIRIDKAIPNEIREIIDWVVKDDFWDENILCPESLRKHYPRLYKIVIDKGKRLEDKADDHMPDLDELIKDKKYRDYFNMPDPDKLKKEGKI